MHRRPKVALFATGDELVPPGAEPGPGQIVYSNGFALPALARAKAPRSSISALSATARRDHRRGPARARGRRRHSGHHRRRLGRRIRSGAEGLRRRRHGAVVLEDRDAARPAADAWPARRHACARPAGQSGFVLCLRFPVPGPADPPHDRAQTMRRSCPNRRCSAATSPPTTSAPIICARRCKTGRRPRGDAVPDPGQFHDGAAGASRLSLIREPYAPPATAGSACRIVKFER